MNYVMMSKYSETTNSTAVWAIDHCF